MYRSNAQSRVLEEAMLQEGASKLNMYKSGTSFKKEFETSFKGFREQYQMVSKQINENGAQTSQNLDTVVQIAALTKLSKG